MDGDGNCNENTSGSSQKNLQLKVQENVSNISSNSICTPPPSKYGSDYFFTPQTDSKSGVYSDIGNNEVVCSADTPVARPKSPFTRVSASVELSTINFGDINIGGNNNNFPSSSIHTTPSSSVSSCFKTPTGPSSLSRFSVVTSVSESATSSQSQIQDQEGRHESRKPTRQNITKKIKESLIRRREKYKSPVKKFISRLQGRGLKRSPSKINPVKPKRRKRLSGVKELGTKNVGDSSDGEYADNDTSDDGDSSDEHWEIMEESETEMDRKLEENASKCNLTAVNVKNILHQVITNEAVVAMVKNTLMSDEQSPEGKDILYEPKMTRAKMKEVLEKEGEGHRPWPLTPIKESKSKAMSFLELELPDDEEDEEYNPEKDKELGSLSDEDSESVASSQSHFGSPCPRTPITPRSRLSDVDTTPSVRGDDDSLLSPMGPPSSSFSVSGQRQTLGQKFHEAMAEHERKQREEETIALRTRSKFSLTDTSLTELEQNFVAPDITADMYDTNCNDSEWQMFLQSLVVPTENEDTNDGCDDETNDPEYDYLEDINEEENIDKEEIRCDRAVRVSKREMNELMDELFEAYEDLDVMEEKEKEVMKMKVLNNMMTSKKTKSSGSNASYMKITDQERIQIDDQMRKHVQLLSQLYVLGLDDPEHHKDLLTHSKFLINELDRFSKSNTSVLSPSSAYKACNLEDAVRLVNEDINYTPDVKPTKTKKRSCVSDRLGSSTTGSDKPLGYLISKHYLTLSKQQKDEIYDIIGAKEGKSVSDPSLLLQRSTLPNLSDFQKDLIWSSSIFIHPELLPHGKLQVTPQTKKNKRVSFTEAEDNLLAIGMDEFKKLPLYRQLIQKFLVPCKTDEQIKIRIKNLGANKTQENAVKFYKKNKALPKFIRYTEPFSFSQIKSPRDQSQTYQPTWCKELKIKEIILSSEKEDENSGIKRSSSVNIPVPNNDPDDKDEEKSQSAPVTPSQRTVTSDRPQPLTAIKVISHDIDDMDSGLSNMSWPSPTKKHKAISSHKSERLRLCKSPGFIPLHPGMSDNESGPKSPINVRILDRDNIGSPSPLVCDNFNHNSDGRQSLSSSVPPSVVITLGNNVNSLVTTIGTTNSFSFTNTGTTSVSGMGNNTNNVVTHIDIANGLNVLNTGAMPITSVGNNMTSLATSVNSGNGFIFPNTMAKPKNAGVSNMDARSGPSVMVEPLTDNICILTNTSSSDNTTGMSNVTSFTNVLNKTTESSESLIVASQTGSDGNLLQGGVTGNSHNSNVTSDVLISGSDQSQTIVPFISNPHTGIVKDNRDNTDVTPGDDRKNAGLSPRETQENKSSLSVISENSKQGTISDLTESKSSDSDTIVTKGTVTSENLAKPGTSLSTSTNAVTGTEAMSATDDMTATEATCMTATETISATGAISATEAMSATETMSATEAMTATEDMSATEAMTATEDITATEAMSVSESITPVQQPSVLTGPLSSSTVNVGEPRVSLNTSVTNVGTNNRAENKSNMDINTNTNARTTSKGDNTTSSECLTPADGNNVKSTQSANSVSLSQTESLKDKVLTFTTTTDAFFENSLPFESYSSTNLRTSSIVCSTSSEVVTTTTLTTSNISNIVTTVSNCITSLSNSVTLSMSNIYEDGMRTPEKGNMPLHNLSTPESCTSLSSYMASPLENTPAKYQQIQETTPTKSTPSPHYRPIAPNPNTPPPTLQLDIPKRSRGKRSSPRKVSLQQQARAICPKGFVIKTYVSPSKTAASSIKNRVLRRGIRILPTPLDMPKKKLHITVKPTKGKKLQEVVEEGILSRNDTASEYDTMESECMSDDNIDENNIDISKNQTGSARKNQKNRKSRRKRNSDSCKSLESDDTQSETEEMSQDDSQNEEEALDDEDHMATLMAASTTIGFASKKMNSKDIKDNRSKAKKRKDATLAMLASNLLRTDPHKDDRDTAFAQSYLNKAREVLKDDIDSYEKFLKILYDFGKSELSPVQLYRDLKALLLNYPDLVEDFSGFLLPEQAVECGCFMTNQQFVRARTLLRKLEIYFDRHPTHFQKVMKLISKWSQKSSKNTKEIKNKLESMLKGQSHLIEELSLFFDDEPPPESYLSDFEEIVLGDSDDDGNIEFDGYEFLEIPEEDDDSGTKRCQCTCHETSLNQNVRKRNKHCYKCCLKVIDGELYYQVSSKVMKKVKVVYHKTIKAKSLEKHKSPQRQPLPVPAPPHPESWEEDDTGAEKENVDITRIEEPGRSRTMNIKLKISNKKKSSGKGRFLTLNEMAESPRKGPESSVVKHGSHQRSPSTSDNTEQLGQTENRTVTEQSVRSDSTVSTIQNICEIPKDTPVSQNFELPSSLLKFSPLVRKSGQQLTMKQNISLDNASKQSSLSSEQQGTSLGFHSLFSSTEELGTMQEQNVDNKNEYELSHNVNDNKIPPSSSSVVKLDNYSHSEEKEAPSIDVLLEQAAGFSPHKHANPVSSVLQIGNIPLPQDSSCSDILAKAIRVANIGRGDISLDASTSFLGLSLKRSHDSNQIPSDFSMLNTIKEINSKSVDIDGREKLVEIPESVLSFNPDLNQVENINNSSQVTVQYNNSPNDNVKQESSIKIDVCEEKSENPENDSLLTGKNLDSENSVQVDKAEVDDIGNLVNYKLNPGTENTNTKGENLENVQKDIKGDNSQTTESAEWSRESDRIILEAVKTHGPGSLTFEYICRTLTNKTASQISERFHQLLELLTEEETPSEEETEDDRC